MKLKKLKVFREGDWVDDYYRGRELLWEELSAYVGKLVICDYSTESHPWYKVVKITKVIDSADGLGSVIFDDGSRRNGGYGSISKTFLVNESKYMAHIWELNRKGAFTKV